MKEVKNLFKSPRLTGLRFQQFDWIFRNHHKKYIWKRVKKSIKIGQDHKPLISRSSHWWCSMKKGVSEACNFIKKESLAQVFSCEFYEIFKNTFSTEHLRAIASLTPTFAWSLTDIVLFLEGRRGTVGCLHSILRFS